MNRQNRKTSFAILIFIGLFFSFPLFENGSIQAITAVNSAKPGEKMEIKNHLRRGRLNIVDFYSEYCGPCRQISPLLEKLGQKRRDIQVIKVDINRPGIKGIDWRSPLAQQYQLQSIPHFKIYDENGNLKAEGQDAYSQVMNLLQKEGII